MKCIALVLLLAACSKSDDESRPTAKEPAKEPVKAPVKAPPATCSDAASHWADYLHNGDRAARSTKDWKVVRNDVRKRCEKEAWTAEERACWATIEGASSHQRCLDLRKR